MPAVENGLVLTVNKLQSTTKNKLILQLNERRFLPKVTFNALLVALTRVTHGNGLRIMPLEKDDSLDYLMKLHPDKDLRVYMSGFEPGVGNKFSAERAIEATRVRGKKK
jgi:hypothetical protein